MSLEKLLDSEVKMLNFLNLKAEVRTELIASLSTYIQLIEKWGRLTNLTAVRDPLKMVNRHIIDSLSIVPYIKKSDETILDVGTGAGLPGIPLSLVLKDRKFTLLDSHLKKQIFLQHVVQTLKLHNVVLQCIRSEDYQTIIPFDTIVSRAFAPLGKMLSLTEHLLAPQGRFLAMKGKIDPQELDSIGVGYQIEEIINLNYLTTNSTVSQIAERHLIIVMRKPSGVTE